MKHNILVVTGMCNMGKTTICYRKSHELAIPMFPMDASAALYDVALSPENILTFLPGLFSYIFTCCSGCHALVEGTVFLYPNIIEAVYTAYRKKNLLAAQSDAIYNLTFVELQLPKQEWLSFVPEELKQKRTPEHYDKMMALHRHEDINITITSHQGLEDFITAFMGGD